jgi:Transketolase, thiamine diphosphate binding domain
MQYAVLHLTGYPLSTGNLKQQRQWVSPDPGAPEYGHTAIRRSWCCWRAASGRTNFACLGWARPPGRGQFGGLNWHWKRSRLTA